MAAFARTGLVLPHVTAFWPRSTNDTRNVLVTRTPKNFIGHKKNVVGLIKKLLLLHDS